MRWSERSGASDLTLTSSLPYHSGPASKKQGDHGRLSWDAPHSRAWQMNPAKFRSMYLRETSRGLAVGASKEGQVVARWSRQEEAHHLILLELWSLPLHPWEYGFSPHAGDAEGLQRGPGRQWRCSRSRLRSHQDSGHTIQQIAHCQRVQ